MSVSYNGNTWHSLEKLCVPLDTHNRMTGSENAESDSLETLTKSAVEYVEIISGILKNSGRLDLRESLFGGIDGLAQRGNPGELWSIPAMSFGIIKLIKGDYNCLPEWAFSLVKAFAHKEQTRGICFYKEDPINIFHVFINDYSAESVLQYCELFVEITKNNPGINSKFLVSPACILEDYSEITKINKDAVFMEC